MARKKILVSVADTETANSTTLTLTATDDTSSEVVGKKTYNFATRPAKTEYKKWVVFAVAGQSNSVGYDESENTVFTNPSANPDRIKQIGLFGDNNLKIIPLRSMAENLQNMTNFGVSAGGKGTKGIHLPLAELLAQYVPEDYGILCVPVAYGMTHFTRGVGTALTYDSTTMKPTQADPSNGTWQVGYAYHQMLRDRVKYALDQGDGKSVNKFAGVIWCQGEADAAQYSGNTAKHPELFQAFVEQLAVDWADYDACSPTGKMDKSVWFVYDTTLYWRKGNNQGVGSIWKGYQEYLGCDHVVNILPLTEYTNSTNGGGTRTSSAFESHYGNNAFRDIVAPKVMDALLAHQMVYGQGKEDRMVSKWETILRPIGARSQGFDFTEAGEVIWAYPEAKNTTINNGNQGWGALLFDEDVVEVTFDHAHMYCLLVYEVDPNNYYFQGLLWANTNHQTNGYYGNNFSRFWNIYANSADKNLLSSGWTNIRRDGYECLVSGTKPGANDQVTMKIDQGAHKVTILLNGEKVFERVETDKITENAKMRIGFVNGWGVAQATDENNNATCLRIRQVRFKNGVVWNGEVMENITFETDATPITETIETTGVVEKVEIVDNTIARVELKGNQITVTPLDAGSTTLKAYVKENSKTHILTANVTVKDEVFYDTFYLYGLTNYTGTNVSDYIKTNLPKTIMQRSGFAVPFYIGGTIPKSDITIKDYDTAVAPYSTIDWDAQTVLYVSAPPSAPLQVTLLYKETTEIPTKMQLCTGAGNATETDIVFKVKKA